MGIHDVLAEGAATLPGALEKLGQLVKREKAEWLVTKLGHAQITRRNGDERFDNR